MRRPGFAPAGDLLSCARQERRQRNAPHSLRPLRGTPAPGCLRGAPHNSLRCCAAAFRQMRRVRSRSGCVLRHTRHPASTPPQAQPEGVGMKPPTCHRCARPQAQAERSDGTWVVRLLGLPHPFCMRRGAQGMADQDSRLFERRRREFERDPASTEHRAPSTEHRAPLPATPASAFSTSGAAQGAERTKTQQKTHLTPVKQAQQATN